MGRFVSRSIVAVSVLLLAASVYMYMNLNRTQVQLQSPAAGIFATKPTAPPVAQNKYVIRNGSNEMPAGMGQADADKKPAQGVQPGGAPATQATPTTQPQTGAFGPEGGITPAAAPRDQSQDPVIQMPDGSSEDKLSEENLTTNHEANNSAAP
ncbi:MAG: hypothetical protein ACYC56_00175 [Candidatus Aquicultor sp.]